MAALTGFASDAAPPGVVASEKDAFETGQTISTLVFADALADLAKGSCYNDPPMRLPLADLISRNAAT